MVRTQANAPMLELDLGQPVPYQYLQIRYADANSFTADLIPEEEGDAGRLHVPTPTLLQRSATYVITVHLPNAPNEVSLRCEVARVHRGDAKRSPSVELIIPSWARRHLEMLSLFASDPDYSRYKPRPPRLLVDLAAQIPEEPDRKVVVADVSHRGLCVRGELPETHAWQLRIIPREGAPVEVQAGERWRSPDGRRAGLALDFDTEAQKTAVHAAVEAFEKSLEIIQVGR